jgi:hypothetical protein
MLGVWRSGFTLVIPHAWIDNNRKQAEQAPWSWAHTHEKTTTKNRLNKHSHAWTDNNKKQAEQALACMNRQQQKTGRTSTRMHEQTKTKNRQNKHLHAWTDNNRKQAKQALWSWAHVIVSSYKNVQSILALIPWRFSRVFTKK